jgi:hypothetical protein
MLNAATAKIPRLALPANESWLPDGVSKSAILFTDRSVCPPIWSAISCAFLNSSIRIGFTKDKDIRSKFDITAIPSILFLDGEHRRVYEGKTRYNEVLKSMQSYFSDAPKPTPKLVIQRRPETTVFIHNLTQLTEFNQSCKGQGTFCIVQGAEKPSEDFEKIARQYRKEKTKFYLCGVDCPVEFARDGIWILDPKREAAIRLESPEELRSSLDRALDGRVMFVPLTKLFAIPVKDLLYSFLHYVKTIPIEQWTIPAWNLQLSNGQFPLCTSQIANRRSSPVENRPISTKTVPKGRL